MILMIDNYDSFTFNLVQYLGELGADIRVFRNDALTIDEIRAMNPEKIVISPGPCYPQEAGISMDVVTSFAGTIPILGVCLGHEAIAAAFGGRIIKAKQLMHGKTSMIKHDGSGVFKGIESPFEATRYHSLAVEKETLPDTLIITASTDDGEIMGLRHKEFNVTGIQFHPESILTKSGKNILNNFLQM